MPGPGRASAPVIENGRMGSVAAVRRYPVKSMPGESVRAALVTGRGLAGDLREQAAQLVVGLVTIGFAQAFQRCLNAGLPSPPSMRIRARSASAGPAAWRTAPVWSRRLHLTHRAGGRASCPPQARTCYGDSSNRYSVSGRRNVSD